MSDKAPENISGGTWDPGGLADKSANEIIDAFFTQVVDEATQAISWYGAAKGRKARASRFLRAAAIVLFVLGGLAPIVAGVLPDGGSRPLAVTQVGYLVLGLAGGFLAFDRFFGMSSGWIRYMTTMSAIERLKAYFLFDWMRLSFETAALTEPEKILRFLDRARTFQKDILELVEKETAAWVEEFRSSIADLDTQLKTQQQAVEARLKELGQREKEIQDRTAAEEAQKAKDQTPGAINLKITGAPSGQIEILIDDATVLQTGARTVGLKGIAAGIRKVEVRGGALTASTIINVASAVTADLTLELA